MKKIMLFGALHQIDDILEGFEIKETKSSTYIQLIAVNVMSGELFIMFRGGKVFYYNTVDGQTLHEIKYAESVGKFYHQFINHKFTAEEIKMPLFKKVEE